MRKKILFVTATLNFGGSETQMYYLGRGLNSLGWEVHVASLASKGMLEEAFVEAGISLHHYSHKSKLDPRQGQFIKNIIRAEKIDIVNAREHVSGFWMCLPYLFSGTPDGVVFTTYLGGIFQEKFPFQRTFERLATRRTDKFFTNSESTRDHALDWYGMSADDIVVIPNGFDVGRLERLSGEEAVRETRTRLNVPMDAVFVIQVARYHPVKKLHDMLQVARRVNNDHPDVYFLIIGSGKSALEKQCEESVRAEHRKLGLDGRFLMPGTSMNPLIELAASDIFLQTSESEGLSNSLIEAMASGLPVVATDVGDTRMIVDEGECGILVKPGDIDGMEEALGLFIEDAEYRKSCGDAGRACILSHYTVERMVDEYEREFLKLLEEQEASK